MLSFGQPYISGVIKGALLNGCDRDQLLWRAGINAHITTETTLSPKQYHRLIHHLTLILDDVYLGFLDSPGKAAVDREVARVMLGEKNLRDAFARAFDFICTVRNDTHRELIEDVDYNQVVAVFYVNSVRPEVDSHLFYLNMLNWFCRTASWLAGRDILPELIHFDCSKPENPIDYEAYFGCPVIFNQSQHRVYFSAADMTLPVLRTPADLDQAAELRAYEHWSKVPGAVQTFAVQVERICRYKLRASQAVQLEDIAATLAISSRTLRRKLTEEDESWHGIKSRVRAEMAKALLRNTDLPIAQIAIRVGFKEPGDFTRAFSQWTSQTPSVWRHDSWVA